MKKISSFLFATSVGVIFLTACSGDDNTATPEPEPANHLLGAWKLNTMSVKSYENGEVVSEYTDVPVATQITWEYDFKQDNTVAYYMLIPAAQLDERGTGTYSLNGNLLTITIDNEPGDFQILQVDADNLHLKLTEEGVDVDITYKDEIDQKFIRK